MAESEYYIITDEGTIAKVKGIEYAFIFAKAILEHYFNEDLGVTISKVNEKEEK